MTGVVRLAGQMNALTLVHSPRCLDYEAPGHPERPERVRNTVARLRAQPGHRWVEPTPCVVADILRVHTPEHLRAVQSGVDHDADTPAYPGIYELARLAAGGAIRAATEALAGHRAFSLMRPPGHHAERDRVMGFCYFNNLAIAVAKMLADHALPRVAIVDFDCHHGNGTEDVFLGDERVRFVSLHQSPCYPGTGAQSQKNCLNFPLRPGTGPAAFLEALTLAVAAVREFAPALVAISAGFDAYEGDPITDMGLTARTYREIGNRLGTLPAPSFAVLEGGYAAELPECVAEFVAGWTAG